MRPTLSVRNPDVESLIRNLPFDNGDNEDLRSWTQSICRDRNAWSVRTAKNRNPNSLGRAKI